MSLTCLPSQVSGHTTTAEIVLIEVRSAAGLWIRGYELLSFDDDGLVTVRSTHTHAVRRLPSELWRDPVETALLASVAQQH